MSIENLNDEAFDQIMTAVMRGRPTPMAGMDLASEALTQARAYQLRDDRLARLARITRWVRMATFAAAALVTIVIAIGYKFLPAETVDTATEAATDAATVAETTSSFDMTAVGIALFLISLITVVAATLFTSDRPQLRLTPA
jgi:hypothetical protein